MLLGGIESMGRGVGALRGQRQLLGRRVGRRGRVGIGVRGEAVDAQPAGPVFADSHPLSCPSSWGIPPVSQARAATSSAASAGPSS